MNTMFRLSDAPGQATYMRDAHGDLALQKSRIYAQTANKAAAKFWNRVVELLERAPDMQEVEE